MKLIGIHLHPVKSTAIRTVASARVERAGLAGDRRWMVLDGWGAMLTARKESRLFTITSDTDETDGSGPGLRLSAPGRPELRLLVPEGPEEPVRVFGDETVGVDAGPEAARWLRAALGRDDVRLVHAARPSARRLDPEHSLPGEHTAFADGYPLLVTTTASLERLNELVAQEATERGEDPAAPLPMARFRPNLVVDGPGPFAEDRWQRLRIGEVVLRVVTPCVRCVMTTVDPVTLERGKEPLRTLARHRRGEGGVLFGQNVVPEGEGVVRVGDQVELLA